MTLETTGADTIISQKRKPKAREVLNSTQAGGAKVRTKMQVFAKGWLISISLYMPGHNS